MKDFLSPDEQTVMRILGRRKMTIQQITEEFYNSHQRPVEGNNYIARVVRRIVKKCEYNRAGWTIVGTGGGRGGRTVWRQKR